MLSQCCGEDPELMEITIYNRPHSFGTVIKRLKITCYKCEMIKSIQTACIPNDPKELTENNLKVDREMLFHEWNSQVREAEGG